MRLSRRSGGGVWGRPRRAWAGIAAAAFLPLGGCGQGVLDPKGPIAHAEQTILFNSLGIMLAVVVPTILATLAFAWWFRASNTRAKYRPDWEYSGQVELVVWSIPAMVVLLLAGICWIGSHELDPPRPIASAAKPLTVEVVALDWKWLFIYPELGVASVNRLTAPAGTPIRFRLTSATVMNSFFVPQLGGQIYAMAGMTTQLNLMADKPGRFPGLAAHFNGDGFSDMKFDVDAVAPAAFPAWVAAAKAQGPVLDRAGYAALARESKAVAPYTYRAVAPGVFDAVVAMTAPMAEGPPTGAPNAAVSPRTRS